MAFNPKYLPKSDVVFTVMFLDKTLCEMTLEAVLGEKIELVDIINEHKNDLRKAAISSIYFDVSTRAVDGRIITLDLQRRYSKERVRNRTVYYACREVAQQIVEKGQYESLKNVVVSFLLTEAPLKHTTANSKIQLKIAETNEVYSELLTIHEVNLRHVDENSSKELQILKSFFEADSETSYQKFIEAYGETPLGRRLAQGYTVAIRENTLLDSLGGEDKYMIRLTDEDRLWERREGRKEGIIEGLKEGEIKGRKEGKIEGRREGKIEGRREGKIEGRREGKIEDAKNLLKENLPLDLIVRVTGLSETEIATLLPQ